MSEPVTNSATTALETLLKLWDRSVALLFALFGICCTLFAAALAALWFGRPDYISSYGLTAFNVTLLVCVHRSNHEEFFLARRALCRLQIWR
jgi:hypothetical protein